MKKNKDSKLTPHADESPRGNHEEPAQGPGYERGERFDKRQPASTHQGKKNAP